MINDYKIYCEKYQWGESVLPEDVNFFSDAEKTLIETVDLKDWITKIGKAKFTNENTREIAGFNYFYFEDSDLSVTIKGNSSNNYFSDFFEIFTNEINVKWLIKIYNFDESELLYTGIVNINKPKQTRKRNENGNMEIDFLSLGMVKEFRDYYANVALTNPNEINWTYETIHNEAYASGTVQYPSAYFNILEGQTITIAGEVYTFKNTPSLTFDVQIGANNYSTILNLHTKINAVSTKVTSTLVGTPGFQETIKITSKLVGSEGNTYSFTTTAQSFILTPSTGYLSGGYSLNIDYNHRTLFYNLLSELLNIDIELDNDLMTHYVTKDCILKNENTYQHNYKLFKSSYERAYSSGESVWGFIKGICNARGYIPFIENGVFKINNRSIIDSAKKITLDYNKIIPNLVFTKEDKKITYEAIIIYDGEWYGGDGAGFGDIRRATSLYLFTNKIDNPNHNTPFAGMTASKVYFPYNRWFKILSSDVNETKITVYEDITNDYGAVTYTLNTKKILFINGGDTKEFGWVFDNSANVNRPHTRSGDTGIGNDDIYFKGNYGNCLFKYENEKIFTYEDYMLSDLALNNFSRFLNSTNVRKANFSYKMAKFNPLFYIDFANVPDNSLNGDWKINDMEMNIENNIIELNIQQKQ